MIIIKQSVLRKYVRLQHCVFDVFGPNMAVNLVVNIICIQKSLILQHCVAVAMSRLIRGCRLKCIGVKTCWPLSLLSRGSLLPLSTMVRIVKYCPKMEYLFFSRRPIHYNNYISWIMHYSIYKWGSLLGYKWEVMISWCNSNQLFRLIWGKKFIVYGQYQIKRSLCILTKRAITNTR